MYRNQDGDNDHMSVPAVPAPEARPINQAELGELQRAEADIPAPPSPAAAPRDPAAPTSGAPGAALDVVDFDAAVLAANSWVKIAPSGASASRPSPLANGTPPYLAAPGFHYFDTTISKLIVFDGATWRDPATGSAV